MKIECILVYSILKTSLAFSKTKMPIPELKSVAHLNQLLRNYRVVVVDIYTVWCGPCKVLAPKLEQLSDDYMNDTVIFVKENAEQNQIHTVEGYPTIVFYVDNKKYKTVLGPNFNELVAILNEIFTKLELVPKIVERNSVLGTTTPPSVSLTRNHNAYSSANSDGYARMNEIVMPQTYLPQGSSVRREAKKTY